MDWDIALLCLNQYTPNFSNHATEQTATVQAIDFIIWIVMTVMLDVDNQLSTLSKLLFPPCQFYLLPP